MDNENINKINNLIAEGKVRIVSNELLDDYHKLNLTNGIINANYSDLYEVFKDALKTLEEIKSNADYPSSKIADDFLNNMKDRGYYND